MDKVIDGIRTRRDIWATGQIEFGIEQTRIDDISHDISDFCRLVWLLQFG
jgi:hypothetical protein